MPALNTALMQARFLKVARAVRRFVETNPCAFRIHDVAAFAYPTDGPAIDAWAFTPCAAAGRG